ncbi:MAG: hypothetical protein KatS3mg118_1941 [Paracoccaceae bacterium]|nr:MAG: hypothetical protein KatS3mg118_1941 [Paracoccaceae bacterium]
MEDFENAKDKVMMGAERAAMAMTEKEKRLTAYHEAGHAIVGLNCPDARPDPQGDDHPARPRAGLYCSCPTDHRDNLTEQLTRRRSRMAMGGRVAEDLVFGSSQVTERALDIQQGTRMARAMVTQFGMSEKLGH